MAGGLLLQSATGALNERSMLPFSLVYHDGFYLPLGAHVFPGEKYRLVHERLLETRAAAESDFVIPQTIEMEDVLRVHERGYVERLIDGTLSEQEILRMELPYSKPLVDATLLSCGGTLQAARLGLEATIVTRGREGELRELTAATSEFRLVTLVGRGGIGKSRLALAFASGIREGETLWVQLGSSANQELVAADVAMCFAPCQTVASSTVPGR